MGVQEPDSPEPARSLPQTVELGNENAFMVTHEHHDYMAPPVNKQTNLPFHLPGDVGQFMDLFRSKTRIRRIDPEVKSGKKLDLAGLEPCQVAQGFFSY